jgi:ribonuclease T2
MRFLAILLLTARAAFAEDERAGEFDYYVLALSWSPTWCALEGDARNAPQCDPKADAGWVLHGLWPQYEDGWPSYCAASARNPSRGETAAQADLFGSSGNAWHQWNKHGRCSGLESADYYRLARLAYDQIVRPEIFTKLRDPVRLPASVVEEAFLEANPDLSASEITITCRSDRIQEARICLTRDLESRTCGADVIQDCTLGDALLEPIR